MLHQFSIDLSSDQVGSQRQQKPRKPRKPQEVWVSRCGRISRCDKLSMYKWHKNDIGYPLVMTNIAIENGHRNSGFSHWKWWFSIAMLNYQRITWNDMETHEKSHRHVQRIMKWNNIVCHYVTMSFLVNDMEWQILVQKLSCHTWRQHMGPGSNT